MKHLKYEPERSIIGLVLIVVLTFCLTVLTISSCSASQPDPWFRMTSPSRCSGGWIHASREFGVYGATAKHCVRRKGRSVRVKAYWDGFESPTLKGVCYGSHDRHDGANEEAKKADKKVRKIRQSLNAATKRRQANQSLITALEGSLAEVRARIEELKALLN